jgi:predicted dienelactone hydrolase
MWRADDLRPPGNQKDARRRAMGGTGARARVLLAVLAVGSVAIVGYGHRKPITLPRPDGPFAVGRLVTAVVFPNDAPSTAMAEGLRIVWCWYPAPSNSRAARAPYLPPAWRDALESHRGPLMSTLVNRDLSRVFGHSLDHPPVAALDSPMRLVFLRAGLAALTVDYTSLAEHLASYGYMVVGIDAPGRTALVVLPDRRVVTRPANEDPELLSGDGRARAVDHLIDAWADDMVELADGLGTSGSWLPRFEGRFDATRISIVGHSLGGATAAEFCRRDARCDLGIDLDGALGSRVITDGLRRPFAFVLSDHGSSLDAESQAIADNIESVFRRLPPSSRWRGTLRGAHHFSFSDQMLVRNPAPLLVLRALGFLAMDPGRGLKASADVVRRLLASRNVGQPGLGLDIRAEHIPELVLH